MYRLLHGVKGKEFKQDFEELRKVIDAGDKLWNSYQKEDQERLDFLVAAEVTNGGRKIVKCWKKLGVDRGND